MTAIELDAGERARLLEEVAQIGKDVVGPNAMRYDRERAFPRDSIDALRKGGFLGLGVPKQFGGLGGGIGGDYSLLYQAVRQTARWCTSTAHILMAHSISACQISAVGTPEQKQKHLTETAEFGQVWGSWASEVGASLLTPDTVAKPVDGGYVVNGRKFFSTNSTGADMFILWAVAEGGNILENLLMLILSPDDPGVEIVDDWDGMGQRGTGSGTSLYTDVFVPIERVIGGAENVYFNTNAAQGLIFQLGFASIFQGTAEGAFRDACAYVKSHGGRHAAQPKLANDPYVQLHVADMDVRITAGGFLLEEAMRVLSGVEANPSTFAAAARAVYRAKVYCSQLANDVTHDVFRLCGTSSTLAEHPFEMYWRNVRTLSLHDPVDWRREAIGKSVLGLGEPPPGFL